jgi:hypothetical protein
MTQSLEPHQLGLSRNQVTMCRRRIACIRRESSRSAPASHPTRQSGSRPATFHQVGPRLNINIIKYYIQYKIRHRGVTKKCRLSWLTNSAIVYEPKCGRMGWMGWGGGGVSANEQSLCAWSLNKLQRSNSIFNL